jgi:hypothetical protein
MIKNKRLITRYGYSLTAALLLAMVIFPALKPVSVHASQIAYRSITLSDSGRSGTSITGIGSGTNVTYRISLDLYNNADSMVIDFCANDPIINDHCKAPKDMDVSSTAVINGVDGTSDVSAWTLTNTSTANNKRLKLAIGSGSTISGAATPVRHTFSITGVTNTSKLGSFYARIYTYANGTFGTYASPTLNPSDAADVGDPDDSANPSAVGSGNYLDYGGIAMTTNNIISITARVQESLSFCVSGTNPALWNAPDTGSCSDTAASDAPALTLGSGAPTPTLSATAVDYGTVYSQISTNATNGAVIAMRNSNSTCSNDSGVTFPSGLSADNGLTCAITGVGSTAAAIAIGSAKFGMFAWASVPEGPSSVGSITPTSTYYNATHHAFTVNGVATDDFTAGITSASDPIIPTDVYYGMDYSTAAGSNSTTVGSTAPFTQPYTQFGNIRTTFGSIVGTTTTPVYRVNSAYTFAAAASLTTPAGVYTANLDLIATGTF